MGSPWGFHGIPMGPPWAPHGLHGKSKNFEIMNPESPYGAKKKCRSGCLVRSPTPPHPTPLGNQSTVHMGSQMLFLYFSGNTAL